MKNPEKNSWFLPYPKVKDDHPVVAKGNRAFPDLRYGEEDRISPRLIMFDNTKG